MAFTFGGNTDTTTCLINNGLTDREAETGALYEIIELDKAFEDSRLFLFRNTSTRILTIEAETILTYSIDIS